MLRFVFILYRLTLVTSNDLVNSTDQIESRMEDYSNQPIGLSVTHPNRSLAKRHSFS